MGLLLDDWIWLWLIVAERFNAECCSGDIERPGDIVLSSMLRAGLHNWSELERPLEVSTRSMRYAACLADRLWEGIESEGTASTSQGNGQCPSNEPTWNTASTF